MRPEEDEYDNDDFVVDDEEEPDWRQALKSVTRYDPSKYTLLPSCHKKLTSAAYIDCGL